MRVDETSDLLYECVSDETSKNKFISNIALSRKRKHQDA